ncbi:hypothetical protein D1AOALGA4SA_3603 [Olavius algarvensis Delta 1 endosymbiont]|nr:hypothetical protein D1AOALGA4SA_3603 [Olavius algarvensis Delta 1 endosymbiont]
MRISDFGFRICGIAALYLLLYWAETSIAECGIGNSECGSGKEEKDRGMRTEVRYFYCGMRISDCGL